MSDEKKNAPIVMKVEAGVYAWCACGKTGNEPYCDGSHAGTGMTPVVERITEERTVAWCACRKTDGAPFCDGSHAKG